jgi:nucleotide-binding universal stress UspA family protein
MIKTIIVPTDGSQHANNAVKLAGEVAAQFDARLIILQVLLHHTSTSDLRELCKELGATTDISEKLDSLDEVIIEASAAAYAPVPIPVPPAVLRQIGELIVTKAREAVEACGVSQVTTQVVDGKPADCIIAAAEVEKADMIVMGRRGLGNVTGLLMGSVSHKVSHLADCACVTVK